MTWTALWLSEAQPVLSAVGAFGKWMEQVGFYPLVAGLVRSTSSDVGMALHFAIAIVIGASFGVLFQRDVRSAGSDDGIDSEVDDKALLYARSAHPATA